MPFTSARLRPGVNTMMTLSANEAGVSKSQLVRYQQGLIQKLGGWTAWYPIAFNSTVREIWAWQGLTGNQYLAVGATGTSSSGGNTLNVITQGSATDISPQTMTTNHTPNISLVSGSTVVTIVDAGSSASGLTTIYFNTPISIGGQIINGAYAVTAALGSSFYNINIPTPSTATVTSSGVVPFFTVSSGTAIVNVQLPNNGYQVVQGLYQQFIAPTTLGGITIQGPYTINTVIDSTQFTISAANQGSSAATGFMNGGNAQIVYYYTIGPPGSLGYGGGGFGSGGFGSGATAPSGTGTPITATDWSLTNWGETLLAVPSNGPVYAWSANAGYQTAKVVTTAPFFNGGCFVSQPQQILVLWGSVESTGVQDPLIVRWSDALDFTNYNVTSQTWAGSFRIPTGSVIKGGIQSAQQGIIWTDIECWVMQNVGQPIVFGFNRVGSGCGLVGQHAMGLLNGDVHWMGFSNFFILSNGGVQPIPCSVWNFVFENIDTNNYKKVRCATNALFSEVAWFFPALNGTGENTLYVKWNKQEGEWDFGSLGRSAWVDVSIFGAPLAIDSVASTIYQHEDGYNAGTAVLDSSFQSGYWAIAEGEDIAFVDWILPDMTFTTYPGGTSANVQITFFATYYTGDTPVAYGPYTFTNATEFINTRIRGRYMSIKIESQDLSSFWRIGRIRYRYALDGRR